MMSEVDSTDKNIIKHIYIYTCFSGLTAHQSVPELFMNILDL